MPHPALLRKLIRSAVSIPWTPLDIDGCLIWLDAEDFTSNGAVATWTNKGSGNDAIQISSGNRPASVLNQQNGLPVVRFTGTNSTYLSMTPCPILGLTQYTVLVVHKYSGVETGDLYSFGTGGVEHATKSDGAVVRDWGAIGTYYTLDAEYHYITKTYNVGDTPDSTLFDNGISAGVGDTYSPPTGTAAVFGAYSAGLQPMTGDIAEFICYNTDISVENLAIAHAYLANKWGI